MSNWRTLFDTDPQGTRAFIDPRATDLSTIFDITMSPTNMASPRQYAPANRPISQGLNENASYHLQSTTDCASTRHFAHSLASLRRFNTPRPYVSIRPRHWRRLQIAPHPVQLPHNAETHPIPPLRPAPHLEAIIDRAWADPTLVVDIENAARKRGSRVVSVIFEVAGVPYPPRTESSSGGWSEGESDSGMEADDEASRSDGGDSEEHTGPRFSQRRRAPVARVMLDSNLLSLGRLILQLQVRSFLKRRRLDEWGFDVSINTPTKFKWGKKDKERRRW